MHLHMNLRLNVCLARFLSQYAWRQGMTRTTTTAWKCEHRHSLIAVTKRDEWIGPQRIKPHLQTEPKLGVVSTAGRFELMVIYQGLVRDPNSQANIIISSWYFLSVYKKFDSQMHSDSLNNLFCFSAKALERSEGTGRTEYNVKQGRARKEGNPACHETKAKGTCRLEPPESSHWPAASTNLTPNPNTVV